MFGDRNLKKYFEEIGVNKGATQKEITKAYRKKALKVHPDRHLSQPKKYTELFKKLTRAHNVLTGTERPTPSSKTTTPRNRRNWSPPSAQQYDDEWTPEDQYEDDIDEDEEFVYVNTPPKKPRAKKPKAKKPKAKKPKASKPKASKPKATKPKASKPKEPTFKKKTNTASVCLDFKLDSGINPRTGRKIKNGGPTYNKIKKECDKFNQRS